jgi:protein tyrosine phosphatase (PTP) superfamily phosphohydrolase (DUF442 family)
MRGGFQNRSQISRSGAHELQTFIAASPPQRPGTQATGQPWHPKARKDQMFTKLSDRLKTAERALGEALGTDISTPRGRRRAFWHFHLLDHGVLRTFWTNLFEVAPGVWRSNQPSPGRLRRYKRMGIKSVLNLRGANTVSPYMFERETCDEIGLTLVDHAFQARHLSDPKVVLALLDQFETIEHPFVMHCKSGADRAGLAAALYLMHMRGVPIGEAKKQLSLKFIHFRSFQTGILDHMLAAYENDTALTPMPIREWIETRYDKDELTAQFNKKRAKP